MGRSSLPAAGEGPLSMESGVQKMLPGHGKGSQAQATSLSTIFAKTATLFRTVVLMKILTCTLMRATISMSCITLTETKGQMRSMRPAEIPW
mmetsp:Transcript_60185/g.167930  ORF Transcript_60185/g.167930 Transcript_60185/m.167930 type:complete len:92 (+) Transcript_60185:741-1016(+)